MNRILAIIIGIVLVLAPILVVLNAPPFYSWGPAATEFLKGGVVVGIVLAGIVMIILGITE